MGNHLKTLNKNLIYINLMTKTKLLLATFKLKGLMYRLKGVTKVFEFSLYNPERFFRFS